MTVQEGTVDALSFCLQVTGFSGSIFRNYRVVSSSLGTAKSKKATLNFVHSIEMIQTFLSSCLIEVIVLIFVLL